MKEKLILVSSGHGGIDRGQYTTPGKRYYGIHDGIHIRLAEGAWNKYIAAGVVAKLHLLGVPAHNVNPENQDIPIWRKVVRVNNLAKHYNCFLLEIHHNSSDLSHVHGTELFTSTGDTKADPLAEIYGKAFTEWYPDKKLRRERVDQYSKDAPFGILERTIPPAILFEWDFMSSTLGRDFILKHAQEQVNFHAHVIKDYIYNRL